MLGLQRSVLAGMDLAVHRDETQDQIVKQGGFNYYQPIVNHDNGWGCTRSHRLQLEPVQLVLHLLPTEL